MYLNKCENKNLKLYKKSIKDIRIERDVYIRFLNILLNYVSHHIFNIFISYNTPINLTYRYLLTMPTLLILCFLPSQAIFAQPSERLEQILDSRFLRNSAGYGVGFAKTEPIPTRRVDGYPRVSSRRDVLTGEKIGAMRRICSAPRVCRFLPGGDLLARLHSRSQFAGTLDADDVSATSIHY